VTVTSDDATTDPRHIIAELQCKLDACARELAQRMAERNEALAQQTATAEVLQVINSSPGALAPVFDAMLEKAMALCGAAFGIMATYDGTNLRPVAMQGIPPRFAAFAANPANQPGPGGATPRLAAGAPFVHVADLKEEEAYRSGDPYRRALVEIGGARSLLAVPLRKDGVMVGQIGIYRQEVRPFTNRQIALLQNFAAQAVIAMENARLLTETREALEQQTATAEVLQVINSSPGDLAPVFDAMLDWALRLCVSSFGELRTYDGERFHLVATQGVPTAYVEHYARADSGIYGPGTGPAQILAGERVVHIPDLIATEPYQRGDPDRHALVDLGGARAYVLVPLLKETAVLGYIMIYRMEVGPFTDKQLALLQNFAAQAVIAMENARLLTETREALEQQTATAEVLEVINSSPGDLAPVFDTMLERALRLCEAACGTLWTYNGEAFQLVAKHDVPPEFDEFLRSAGPLRPQKGSWLQRLVEGENLIQSRDQSASAAPSSLGMREALIKAGARSSIWIALRKDDALVGAVHPLSQRDPLFYRQADRAAAELRGASGHRN